MYKNSRKRKNKHFTFIQINNRKRSIKNHLKYAKKNKRNYFVNGRLKKDLLYKVVNSKNEKFIKSMSILLGISAVAVIFVSIFFLRYIKGITTELPSPDNPFRGKDQTSIIYASNDNENGEKEILYTVFGEENRELVKIEEVPEIVKWSVLAAEDIDFYNHSGVDPGGVYKAATNYFLDTGESRGGSTITQQLIKQTTLGDEYSVDRKFREMLLAMEVEKLYSKDQILEMYLNVNNYGSNVYGIKTAAKFYFGKELSELTLSEAAIIARIPQSPVANSPTLSPDPKEGQKKALEGREYILSQIENNLDKVNSFIQNDSNLFNLEKIQAAREEIPSYLQPKISIQAPHFVFYVEEVLTTKPYNNGTPFTLNELQSGGYRIYTTLDTNIQEVALKNVQDGVNRYGMPYGGHNAAAVVTDPKTGDVLA
ncbi:MAG TPA: transglycosylase domain-containing protein, partial [Candidatus Dojkabacteria bacterium]